MASGGKAKKMRGNHTHGRGKKAGRGAGLAGGRGRAGANKHRFLMLQILGGKHEHMAAKRWGRVGFKYRSRDGNPKPETVNVGDLALRFPGQAELDLKAQGIGKLLGSGEISHKVTIKVDHASAGAIEKVKAAGGQVTVLVPKVEKVAKPAGKPDAKGNAPKPGAPPSAAKQGGAPAAPKDAKPAAPKGDKPAGAGKPAGDKPHK